jgi:uncharacterized membrane protein SirB2
MEALLITFSKWLASTGLSHAIQRVTWIIPTLQTIHILCVAIVFSSVVLVNLRIFRLFERDEPLRAVARRFLPPIWPVLLVLLLTGSLLIIGEPRRSLINVTFYIKMSLLLIAILLTALLQRTVRSSPDFFENRQMAGRTLAAASILVWSGILFAGRWIAYTQAG